MPAQAIADDFIELVTSFFRHAAFKERDAYLPAPLPLPLAISAFTF